jgi:hypothetical protein
MAYPREGTPKINRKPRTSIKKAGFVLLNRVIPFLVLKALMEDNAMGVPRRDSFG